MDQQRRRGLIVKREIDDSFRPGLPDQVERLGNPPRLFRGGSYSSPGWAGFDSHQISVAQIGCLFLPPIACARSAPRSSLPTRARSGVATLSASSDGARGGPSRDLDRMMGEDVEPRRAPAVGPLQPLVDAHPGAVEDERANSTREGLRRVAEGAGRPGDDDVRRVDALNGIVESAQHLTVELGADSLLATELRVQVLGKVRLVPRLVIAHPGQVSELARVTGRHGLCEVAQGRGVRHPGAGRGAR